MSAADSRRFLQHIRRLAGDPPGAASDAELLHRYLERRDQAAFSALIRRHGPMVFAACRSVLRQDQDAEDAFQATFLILMQKAGSIRQQHGLGGWLQRVAYRVALRARTNRLRRRSCEEQKARSPEAEPSCDDISWRELRSILHAELAALPEKFRAPLVLCYLEGLTQEEAALRLDWTATTVKGRLQRGREKLRRRLERRGVALTAALGAALTGQTLAETSIQAVSHFTLETATKTAAALAHGFLQPLVSMKMMALSAVLLSLGVAAGGVVLRSTLSEPRPIGSGDSNRFPAVAAPKEAEPHAAVDAHGDPLPEGAVARLGTVRFNHGGGMNALFFSPDGKTIISEGNGGVRLWDADDGKERGRIHTDNTAHPPYDQTMLLADGKTLVILRDRKHGEEGDVAHVCDLSQKRVTNTRILPIKRQGWSFGYHDTLSPDGKRAVLHVKTPAQVRMFDLTTGKELYQLAKGEKEFLAVAFAGNDRIVSSDSKQRLEVWEARTGKLLRHIDHEAPIRYLLSSRDGRWLVSMEHCPWDHFSLVKQEVVHLWDMRSGALKHSFRPKGQGQQFNNVCFSPDGQFLLTSSVGPFDTDEVALWDIATGRRLQKFDKATGINAEVAAISSDGSRLVAGSRSGKFALWDLKTGQRLTKDDNLDAQAGSVTLSPTGDRATIIGRQSISAWDATSGRRLETYDITKEMRNLWFRARSTDGRYAVSYSISTGGGQLPAPPPSPQKQPMSFGLSIHIWDIVARKCLHTLRVTGEGKQSNEVSSAFTADSSLLATWLPGNQSLIRLWDPRSGKLIRSFPATKVELQGPMRPGQMRFTADGKTLFVAGKGIAAYDVASGKELFSWRMKPFPESKFGLHISSSTLAGEDDRSTWHTLAISPEGDMIAAAPWPDRGPQGSKEDAIVLLDAQTGKLLRRCHDPHTITFMSRLLAFSSDGQLLASTSGLDIVYLWETATGKLIRTFKGHEGQIGSLIFSSDCRRLASASTDSVSSTSADRTVLIWDVTGQAAKSAALTEAKLKECWNDLAGEDAGRAHRAVWTLIRAPRQSIPLLQAHLHPVKPVSSEQIERWIRDLDADAFEKREKAMAELENLGKSVEPALRCAMANKPTLEQRRRIEPMLAKLESAIPPSETLRSLRAVRVLEHAGTPEAQRLLDELAGGAEGAWITCAARAARTRLNRRVRIP